jgi:hypothetical protein
MWGQRPLSISRASSYSPLSSNSLARLQHSSARPPTSRFGFTKSRKSEARNIIVRIACSRARRTPNCAPTLTQLLRACKKKLRRLGLIQEILYLSMAHKIVSKLSRMCAVAIVTAVLAVPAFAGIMDAPGAPAPAPTPSQTSSTSTSMTTVILTILGLIR